MIKKVATLFSCLCALFGVGIAIFGAVQGQLIFLVVGGLLALIFAAMAYFGRG